MGCTMTGICSLKILTRIEDTPRGAAVRVHVAQASRKQHVILVLQNQCAEREAFFGIYARINSFHLPRGPSVQLTCRPLYV